MGCKWRKAKLALGLNLCLFTPRTLEDSSEGLSDAALLSSANLDLSFSRSGSESSEQTCPICLSKMNHGDGDAIFTAECSHCFHFHCIVSNVNHGNEICPVCRAKWQRIPMQLASSDAVCQFHSQCRDLNRRPCVPLSRSALEPSVFDDDELLDHQCLVAESCDSESFSARTVEIKTFPEFPSAPRSNSYDDFNVLVNLKAAAAASVARQNPKINQAGLPKLSHTRSSRAPIDLVTVLDISGSMVGTKLALLKRAMGFVIQHLGSNDRLSVIAFSSKARRLFPLLRMTDTGRLKALQAVNSLFANGGTNIAEGIRKGVKVMEERREMNPVSSMILLSDGQDNYTVQYLGRDQHPPNYLSLLPFPIQEGENPGFQIPVHTFGFGTDHDASLMHFISEISGGTFSFIETEGMIQDAFAQCIGGLLSVVVQELQVVLECTNSSIRFGSLKAGSYPSRLIDNGRTGIIDVGDLYADEERDFLVSINVPGLPAESSITETSLFQVKCVFKDPLTKETETVNSEEVRIQRPEMSGEIPVSIEVDRQRNRFLAADAIAEARAAAERGNLAGAVSILGNCRRLLSLTVSAKCQDRLCLGLDAELKEMQLRMATRHDYEVSGRGYVLSGLSSHSWQRATARGDSTDSSSLVQAYLTPSMLEMLTQSQSMLLGSSSTQSLLQPLLSFKSQPRPR